ncbi:hypothetical protein G7Y79_00008g024500 [Physcia stellaris]|nr:hypothetical protein G7Y79_00008g024500 [Physcia stellaris]
MHSPVQTVAFASLALLLGIDASPVSTRSDACGALNLTSTCWDTLGMTNYLNTFVQSGLNASMKHGSCNLEDTWSRCFLNAVVKKPKMDCSFLYSTTCEPPTAAVKDARAYYAAWNIWSTHSYLNNWAYAISEIVTEDFDVIKENAKPVDSDQSSSANTEIQNIDTVLKNMILKPNRAQASVDAAMLALMKEVPSTLIYNTSNTGLDIGNQLQQRLVQLMNNVSTHEKNFLTLAGKGQFSRQLPYGSATIIASLMPEDGGLIDITDGEVRESIDPSVDQ